MNGPTLILAAAPRSQVICTLQVSVPLVHAQRTDAAQPPPDWIMWMPAGTNEIVGRTRDGRPAPAVVQVDRSTAAVMQDQLRNYQASRRRPSIDFAHANTEAAGWVEEFQWRDAPEPGVWARIRWSDAGRAALNGRSYREFSPSFFLDKSKPGRVIGAPLIMGGLTNDPAFDRMRPMWAQRHPSSRNHPQVSTTMNKTQKLIAALAALKRAQEQHTTLTAQSGQDNGAAIQAAAIELRNRQSEVDTLMQEIQAESGADAGEGDRVNLQVLDARAALDDKDRALNATKAENERLKAEIQAQRKQTAKTAVDTAIARGVIPAQNTQLRDRWLATIEADPGAAELLASAPAPQVLNAGRMTGGGASIQVTQGDLINAMEAYGMEIDAGARAAIWKADIRPRVEKEQLDLVEPVRAIQNKLTQGRYPIHASNTLGTLTGTLVVQRSLDFLKLSFPILGRISTDFSGEPVKFGQTIQTRLRAALATTTFVPANGYQDAGVTTTDVPVVLNKHEYVQIKFGVEELAATMRGLFDEQEEPMHYAVGKKMTDDLYALITAANYTHSPTISSQANFKRKMVVKMGTELGKRGVPNISRTLLLNGDYYGELASDETIVALAAYQQPGIITAGQLPDVHGFRVIEAHNLPTAENLTGFGCRADAWAMASRPPSDYTQSLRGAPATGVVQMVTNPDTGITVMLVQWVDHLAGAARGRVAIMYGVAKGQVASGQRLVSAAA